MSRPASLFAGDKTVGDVAVDEAQGVLQAIAGLEAQRALLGDAVVNPAIAALRQKLALDVAPKPATEAAGERKTVTIMFADLTGFTALSERMDPEALRDLVNDVFDRLVPIVERHGGVIDKFMGDAIMALFGARVANEDDPQRALSAALAMAEAMNAIAAERTLSLGIHFGINTGPVVTGAVGSSERHAFSVMGDAVNLASRLEDLSDAGEILVGPATRRQAAAQFDFEERPPVTLKGKQKPVPIFRLIGRKREEDQRGRLAAPLFGRRIEMERLLAALGRVGDGHGGVICVVGEAGLGKTRLITEAWQRSPTPLRWLRVPPRRHGHASGFGAVRALLLQLLDCEPDAGRDVLNAALRRAVERHWQSDGAETLRYLAALMGLDEGTDASAALDALPADLLHARFGKTVGELLARCAAEQPTVVVWEDLHWADPSSLKLATALFGAAADGACLHLATVRPEPEIMAVLAAAGPAMMLTLEPIGPDASREMLRALIATDVVDEQFARNLLGRAEGNPFFLEELIQSLIDTGALVVGEGKATAGVGRGLGLGELLLPPTLQGVMMARLDRLTAAEKKIVQIASVLGRTFERRTLNAMVRATGELEPVLRKLEIIDIIRPTAAARDGGEAFKFKHAVTQEVAYGSLLLTTRRQLHRRAADTILREARPTVAPALLAHHFEHSDHPVDAAPYLLQAARAARDSHAIGEALDFYGRVVALDAAALATEGRTGLLIDAQAGRGELLQLSSRCDEALDAFGAALDLLTPADKLRRAGLLRRSGLTEMARRNAAAALMRFGEADDALGDLGDHATDPAWLHEWIEVRLERLWALGWAGQYKEAARITSDTADVVARHGDAGHHARLLMQHFIFRSFKEDTRIADETIALGREAIARTAEWGDPKGMMVCRLWFGWGLLLKQAWPECEDQLLEALRLARLVGDVEYEVMALIMLASRQRLMNVPDETDILCDAALGLAQRADMPIYIAAVLANQAWVALRAGETARARQLAESAAATWRRLPYKAMWLAHWPLLSLAIDDADWAQAAASARILRSRDQYHMPDAVAAALDDALAALDRDDPVAAQTSYREARRLARPLGMA